MKNLIRIIFILFSSNLIIAQVGIGTTNPHSSSILDIHSSEKGVLMPTLSSLQRDAITSPANGLLIYNSTTSNYNYFDAEWRDFSPKHKSVNFTDEIFTTSNTAINIPGMILSPAEGVYSVSFDSQINNNDILSPSLINSGMLLADYYSLYNQLVAYPVSRPAHGASFGSGEVLNPGKYYVGSAVAVSGTITLDGLGDPDSIFIIYAGGALSFAAGTTVVVTNGASAENIFWLAEGAIAVGANSTVYGNLTSHGAAVSVGVNCSIKGRLLTNTGALACGPGIYTVPTNLSTIIDVGSLETFVMYTGAGAISNTGVSIFNGNICTGAGATSLSSATVNGIIVAPIGDTNINNNQLQSFVASFGVYQNDVLIPHSTRHISCSPGYSNISLTTLASVLEGETITMKWKINSGKLTIGNRIMTIIKVQ